MKNWNYKYFDEILWIHERYFIFIPVSCTTRNFLTMPHSKSPVWRTRFPEKFSAMSTSLMKISLAKASDTKRSTWLGLHPTAKNPLANEWIKQTDNRNCNIFLAIPTKKKTIQIRWMVQQYINYYFLCSFLVWIRLERCEIYPAIHNRIPAGPPAGAGSYWKHCLLKHWSEKLFDRLCFYRFKCVSKKWPSQHGLWYFCFAPHH